MHKIMLCTPFALLLAFMPLSGIAQGSLQSKVAVMAKDAKGTVNVSCMLLGTKLNCDLNSHNHPPMQSMYKLPLALTALHMADVGTLLPTQRAGEPMDVTLDRTVQFLQTDIIPGSFSPLTDRYPKANVNVKLREIISLAVGQSDNGAEEVLVRLVGGPLAVEHYMHSLGISAIQVRYSERELECFLLELGTDFAFIGRQKRMTIGSQDFYLDLLFYHRRLARLIAIDLKLGRFEAAYKGQMELYLRWLDQHKRRAKHEESPLGLILCSSKDEEQIELLQLNQGEIRVAKYLTALPEKKLLAAKLHDAVVRGREQLARREKASEAKAD